MCWSVAFMLLAGTADGQQPAETTPRPAITGVTGPDAPPEHLLERLELCTSCHGADGIPVHPEAPIINGQHEGYVYFQLRDYKQGSRKHDTMSAIVADLSRQDLKDLAAFYAKQPWPRTQQRAQEGDELRAETAAASGLCKECHLGGYLGDGTVPRLSGQLQSYLDRTMKDFKTKERGNNPAMSSLLGTYPDEDLEAIARYLGAY